jgi:hypothetical protein
MSSQVVPSLHSFRGAFSPAGQPPLCVDAAVGYSVRPTLVARDSS